MTTFAMGQGAQVDLDRLIRSRLLIQASSGSGKSWLLRRILEQTHGKIQQIVIDPEGEFSSLREKYDYIIAAKAGGDTPADPRAAALLAERLLEMEVSAILDLYELKVDKRHEFVRLFLEALINLPKRLWRPVLITVDESHIFCPEQGKGESVAKEAMIDLCTRGRKRGFTPIFATTRLSKLHKDAAGELLNKVVGRTGLDVDRKRAAEELGFTDREQSLSLRQLEDGQFFAYGPAISREVIKFTSGPVRTTHPEAGGQRAIAAPKPPSARIKNLLPKLADLPAEAEQRQRTLADAQKEISELKQQVRRLEKQQPAPAVPLPPKEIPVLKDGQIARVEKLLARYEKTVPQWAAMIMPVGDAFKGLTDAIKQARQPQPMIPTRSVNVVVTAKPARPDPAADRLEGKAPGRRFDPNNSGSLPQGELAILKVVCQYPLGVRRDELTVRTGYKRSTRDQYIKRLMGRWLLETRGDMIIPGPDASLALGSEFEPLPEGAALQEWWRRRLPEGERKILDVLLQAWPNDVTRENLSDETGYKRSTRDQYIKRLAVKRLVAISSHGVAASGSLFDGEEHDRRSLAR